MSVMLIRIPSALWVLMNVGSVGVPAGLGEGGELCHASV